MSPTSIPQDAGRRARASAPLAASRELGAGVLTPARLFVRLLLKFRRSEPRASVALRFGEQRAHALCLALDLFARARRGAAFVLDALSRSSRRPRSSDSRRGLLRTPGRRRAPTLAADVGQHVVDLALLRAIESRASPMISRGMPSAARFQRCCGPGGRSSGGTSATRLEIEPRPTLVTPAVLCAKPSARRDASSRR
jgi:hypothetical protein